MTRQVPPMKTYSHLAGQRRVPTEYEVVSTALLYHPQKGFEVSVPVQAWYERYQRGGRLGGVDWEKFADPRATTYPAYTTLQSAQEGHLEGVLRSWEKAEHDPALVAGWRETFLRTLAPLRFALHGFQMIAAYVGQLAPAGRLAMVALFQASDELRRVHRIAYQMGLYRRGQPRGADESRTAWQDAPAWQPLRRAVEEALVAYDWGEALVALNLCLKPLVEALFLTELGHLLREDRDFLTGEVLSSLDEDGRWHRDWSGALVRLAVAENPGNAAVIEEWVARWHPRACQAVEAAAGVLGSGGPAALDRAQARARAWLRTLGVEAP